MSEGISGIPRHKDPPFCLSKNYHREVKPDLETLQQEVVSRHKAYGVCKNGKVPRPKNWNKDKCLVFLHESPISSVGPCSEIEFLQQELGRWSQIQITINNSQQYEEARVLQKTWSSDIPYLHL